MLYSLLHDNKSKQVEFGSKGLRRVLSGATVGCHRQQQQQQQRWRRHQLRVSDSAKIDTKKRSSAPVHVQRKA